MVAAEDLPDGAVIAAGSAILALAAASRTTLGPRGRNIVGLAARKGGQSVGQIAEYVAAGPLELDTASWDAVTDGVGGLVPNTVYFLSQTTPGHMTTSRPDAGQIVRLGIALSSTVFDVLIEYAGDFVDAFIFDPSNSGGVIQNNASGLRATGADALAEGDATQATGVRSHAEGLSTSASGSQSHAEGANTRAVGATSHAEGDGTFANGLRSHAEGSGSTAGGHSAHAEGQSTFAQGQGAHTEGISTRADGDFAHAEGEQTFAVARASHAEGFATETNGVYSHAQGERSNALREAQDAFASGQFANIGDAQTSRLVFRGSTPGNASNESVDLKYGNGADQTFQLEDGKTYAVKVVAACGGVQGLSDVTCVLELSFSARRGGGLSSIQGAQVTTSYGDATTWTLTASIGAGPDRVALTFATGAGPASIVNVAAKVEFTEVVRPTIIP